MYNYVTINEICLSKVGMVMKINVFILLGSLAAIFAIILLPLDMIAPIAGIWLAWIITMIVLKKKTIPEEAEKSIFDKMRENDRGKIFQGYIESFEEQEKWLQRRTKVLEEFSDSYASLGYDMDFAMKSNFEKANNYMRACDYEDRDNMENYRKKIDSLYMKNDEILDKINALIEQLAEIENTAEEVDTTHIDDLIESLKQMAAN
ncbi:MAG: hypothetical protein K6G11_03170 [Lachnospiraceae bacterium]|nr:hypothetical protein [Lachnospiraceae bacterium]